MRTRLALLLAFFLSGTAPAAVNDLDFDPSTFDRSVDVCVNPYAYVNNTWLRGTELPADRPMWGPRYAVIERNLQMQRALAEQAAARRARGEASGDTALVGAFLAAGLDQARIDAAGLAPIAADLARIDAINSREDLFAFIAGSSVDGLDLVFDYYVWARGEDPDRHIAYVEQGGRGLSDRDRYLDDDETSKTLRAAYRAHLAKLLELSGTPAADARRQADAAFALESALARASLSSVELRDLGNIFAVRRLEEVRGIAPHFDWARFLALHGHPAAQEISMAQPGFFREFGRQFATAKIADWRAYLRTRLLDTMAPYLATPFAAQHFEFHKKIVQGVPTQPARWKQVLDTFNATPAHAAMGKLFVDTHLPADAKPRALAMVADLRAAFRARIERAAWMGDDTRRAALDKLDRMAAKIGYPDRWPDLSGLAFDPADYAGNVRAAWRFAQRREDAKLDQAVDRGEWHSPAHEINARYYPQTNEIVFPAPMLLPPAFDPAQDPALNYAVLGVIIGHEMTHGFDDQGAQFGADGRLQQWWSADDRHRFTALGTRVAERYSKFEIAPGKPVNGQLTLGENIADLGGLAIAYDALMLAQAKSPQARIDGLSQPQRFFLRYASIWRNKTRPEFAELRLKTDPHAPDEFRAIAPIADMPAFSQAFSCKPDDAMWTTPAARIGVW
jgi:putative endopeptidase